MYERVTIHQIQGKKDRKEKIVVLTAYDYPIASLLDRCGVDIILVGDSLANVVLGLDSTTQVGMTEMLYHAKAVRRAVNRALLVGDMPFEAYQRYPEKALENARRFVEEAGCDAVKVEWFEHCLGVVRDIIRAGIPVMGHVGLTPQTANRLGGLRLQGKDSVSAKRILKHAVTLEKEGCFSVVLECIPHQLAGIITQRLHVPTIGIGAGVQCDGQVLVIHDLLGLSGGHKMPKFVKNYVNLDEAIAEGVSRFCADVRAEKFPDDDHSYEMNSDEFKKIKETK